ncbi:MAG TPA: hypothetical protein VLM18_05370 [Croceibacterium sp.]|nr:hypothetical protein [Croceibacterium sp.]
MHRRLVPALALLLASVAVPAQHIEKVPASKANVSRPDDLFALPPGQWHLAKSLALGAEPCVFDQCEAGFTSGILVISVEHSKDFVRIIAGFSGCVQTAFSEVEVGTTPGKSAFGRVAKQVKRVIKGLAKTCEMTAPKVPELDVASLFPAAPVAAG